MIKSELQRRRFIEFSAQTFLGVSLLRSFGQNALANERSPSAKHVIYLYMAGGMSHMDTFDPKPGHHFQGPTGVVDTQTDGVQVSSHLPLLAQHTNKMAIVRSMTSTAGDHNQGNYLMHTSYQERGTIRHPGLGPWAQRLQGKRNPTLPASVYIGSDSRMFGGRGFFTPEYQPLAIGNPRLGLRDSKVFGRTERELKQNLETASLLDREFMGRFDVSKTNAYTDMYAEAAKLLESEDLEAFDIKKETDATQQRYGNHSFGQGCLLARRLVEHDVRYIEVNLGGWDMHSGLFVDIFDKCRVLDQAMSALLADLEAIGKLDETLVVLATEFGRTPVINKNEGRDHYPRAFSTVLAGGGTKGGVTYGETDAGAERVIDKPVSIADFNATIAHSIGLPLEQIVYSPTKRPFTVANKGKPITELLRS